MSRFRLGYKSTHVLSDKALAKNTESERWLEKAERKMAVIVTSRAGQNPKV
jgi:hypothetical protein